MPPKWNPLGYGKIYLKRKNEHGDPFIAEGEIEELITNDSLCLRVTNSAGIFVYPATSFDTFALKNPGGGKSE